MFLHVCPSLKTIFRSGFQAGFFRRRMMDQPQNKTILPPEQVKEKGKFKSFDRSFCKTSGMEKGKDGETADRLLERPLARE